MPFRLQTLLRLRLAERDERRGDLAKALRAEAVLRGQAAELKEEQAALRASAREQKSPGAANVDRLLATHRYELVLSAREKQLQAQVAQVAAETERRRLALVEADRQVKTLEKLRDRQASAIRAKEERVQAKTLDEMAVLGHVFRQEATA